MEAKDLVTKLLVKDAKKRMSAAEVMKHPWLENNNKAELETPSSLKRYTCYFTEDSMCNSK